MKSNLNFPTWRQRIIPLVVFVFSLSLILAPATAQEGGLAPNGPWVIYSGVEGLVVANADGSGRTVLVRQDGEALSAMRLAPAPTGDRFILSMQNLQLEVEQVAQDYAASLRLVALPGGGARTLAPALLPPTAASDFANILLALAEPSQPAWMPPGDGFVYVSAHEGQADLYLYNVASGTSTRLTNSHTFPWQPIWSPNGRRLLWQERRSASADGLAAIMMVAFGSESGRVVATPPTPLDLELPSGSGWVFVGWQTPDRFLYSAQTGPAEAQGLYAYDCSDATLTTLLPPQMAITPPAFDPVSGTLIVPIPAGGAGLQPGLYRLDPYSGERRFLAPVEAAAISWESALNAFLLRQGEATLLLSPEAHSPTPLPWSGTIIPAPTGEGIAYHRDETHPQGFGLAIAAGPDAPPLDVWLDSASSLPVWGPDGRNLYALIADPTDPAIWWLMQATLDGQVTLIDPGARPGTLLTVQAREVMVFADVEIAFRDAASEGAGVIAVLAGHEPIAAMLGRNQAGDWLAIRLADGRDGWVRATELSYSGNVNALAILAE